MPQVLNKRTDKIPAGAIYVGRPSKWGNPFVIGRDGTREEVIEKHSFWLGQQTALGNIDWKSLEGKDLVCWCSPLPCHADILLEMANGKSNP